MTDRERRIAILRQAVRAKPGESAEWVRLANALIDVGRPEEVPEVFREMTDALPDRPQLHYDVIAGLCERGPHLLLLKGAFERAAAQPGVHGSCFYGFGLIRQIDADRKGALESFTQALALDPALAAVHHNMAVVFLTQDRLSDAIAAAEAAVRTRPNMAEPYFVIGSIHMAERRFRQAFEYLQKFVLLARTPDLEGPAQQASLSLALMRDQCGAIIGVAGSGQPHQVYDSPAPQRQCPSYESIRTGFRENLSRLSSLTGYAAIQDAAAALLDLGRVDSAQLVGRSASRLVRGRDRHVFDMLVSAFSAYRRTDLVEARRLAAAILETDSEVDPWSSVDAEHIVARTQYDEKNLAEAEATLLRVLTRSEQLGYSEGFVRALHEISRVKAQKYEPLDAEAGFRVALEYYSLRTLASRRSGGMGAAHDSDVRNVQSALNCLSALAETYFLLSNGPTEGSRLLQGLRSDFFADDQTGDDFLEIRGLALRLLTKEAREYHAANLIGRAMALLPKHRPLSIYAFDEAAWHGERRGIAYPARLRQIYSRSAGPSLRDSSSFKPNARVETTQHPLRHASPDDAAESIGALYDYLTPLDREGRYVYRGQVKEYDAPLLPSAFRAILTESHGATALPWSSFPSTSRLRDCGESFVGDYNYCFSNYADVTSIGGGHRMDQAAQERVASIYHKLLNDLSLILAQEREGFLSWADAVHSVLPESDLEVYRSNAAEWNVRIDNYHKRTFRDELLVRLFG